MSVGSASNSTAASTTAKKPEEKKKGFEGLTADDFFKLLIAQLQSQDPTEPVSNDQLLNQLSTMRGLQSNIEMSTTLKDLASSIKATQDTTKTPFADSVGQKLSVGNSFIGQHVTFADSTTGVVTAAHMKDGAVMLVANNREMALDKLVSVNSAQALVKQVIEGTGTDADGKTTRLLGQATKVINRDGKEFLEVSRVDGKGDLQVAGEIAFENVEKLISYDNLIGRYVEARTESGVDVVGVATAPDAGPGDKRKIIVNKKAVPIQNVLSFPNRVVPTE